MTDDEIGNLKAEKQEAVQDLFTIQGWLGSVRSGLLTDEIRAQLLEQYPPQDCDDVMKHWLDQLELEEDRIQCWLQDADDALREFNERN